LIFAQAEKSSPNIPTQGTFRLTVAQGRLSLEANGAPVAKIFDEIGKQAGIAVESSIGPEEKITIQLDRVPLEQAIKRLVKNVTIFYAQDRKNKTHRIARVVVLPEGRQKAPKAEASKAQPQKAKGSEPAAKPEPFRFEFDPAKFMEEEKPAKRQ
jgi:hypothetical protein